VEMWNLGNARARTHAHDPIHTYMHVKLHTQTGTSFSATPCDNTRHVFVNEASLITRLLLAAGEAQQKIENKYVI